MYSLLVTFIEIFMSAPADDITHTCAVNFAFTSQCLHHDCREHRAVVASQPEHSSGRTVQTWKEDQTKMDMPRAVTAQSGRALFHSWVFHNVLICSAYKHIIA